MIFDVVHICSERGLMAFFRLQPRRPLTVESSLFNTSVEENKAYQKPSDPEPLTFVLGRDRGGHWIVQETHGLCGGLFASKDAAIRFVRLESAERKSEIRLSPDAIELNCSSQPLVAGSH